MCGLHLAMKWKEIEVLQYLESIMVAHPFLEFTAKRNISYELIYNSSRRKF